MRTIAELLAHLDRLDIELWADGERLRYNAPKGALTRALRSELGARKAELVAYLHELERDQIDQIPTVSRDGTLPLSFAQQRLWFLAQLEGMSNAYNIYGAFRLNGPLDVAAFRVSWQQIQARHEALRTTFPIGHGQARQQVHPPSFDLELIDLSDLPKDEQEAEIARLAHQAANQTFDLINGPLWRVCLLRLGSQEHVLLLTMHHIISDGWSMGILMREFSTLYHSYARSNGFSRSHDLPELPIHYADFAVWQREWLSGDVLQAQLEYWKAQLADAPPLLTLPTDHPRPALQRYRGSHLSVTLPQSLHAELVGLSRQNRTTLFMTLQAAFAVLLSRYAGQEEILIGTPIANRQVADVKDLVGFFVNTLVLRNDLSASEDNPPTFRDVLARTRKTALDAYQHQALPFELLVETLQPERSLSHSPLFQVMFILENKRQEMLSLENVTVTPIEVDYSVAKFDLTLVIQERDEGLVTWWEYNTHLFERGTIERMAGHFQILLEGIVANPDQSIVHLPLLTEREKNKLLVEWNETEADYPEKCIHQLFEQQVERTPEAIALVFEDQALTYYDLNARANQLAHTLIAQGVGPDVLVGICLPRSIEMVVGLLGILKAGAAYVPLDPNYPQERIQFMLDDANVNVLLTEQKLASTWPRTLPQVYLDQDWWHSPDRSNPVTLVRADDLAYCIYTSGSTGRPKGVIVEHRHVQALLSGFEVIAPKNKKLQGTSLCPFGFDVSVWELFSMLCFGGTLHILSLDILADPKRLASYLATHQVTSLYIPPALLSPLVTELEYLKNKICIDRILVGVEPIKQALLQRFRDLSDELRIINGYGPTESTVCATFFNFKSTLEPNRRTPIGKTVANYEVYLVDEYLQPVPIGVPGELHIGGAGLARGYLNRPQLTSEKFIPNPFRKDTESGRVGEWGRGSGRLYKTGDLCRYLPDGNIEFLGRADYQVKVRGFRIELGEIEAQLSQHESIRSVVVVVREEKASKRLVAYFVAQEPITSKILRAYLSQKLPDYMIPSAFVLLSAMPLTPNGKINRHALPDPEFGADTSELVLPRTPIEEILAAIWQEVLGLEQVGIHDNFFEIGGHSLLATQVVSRIRQSLQVELPLRRLFSAPTIAELAEQLTSTERALPPLKPLDHLARTALPLSFAQQRLWFLAQFEGTSDVYNMPAALRLTGPLDVAALSASWQVICERHEALRTTFLIMDGQARQQINPPSGNLDFIDLSDLPLYDKTQEAEVMRLSRQEATRPFDLTNGPLWRVTLLRLGREEHVLLLTMHHIISDGWSIRVLMRELSALYAEQGDNLPDLPIQYADFAVWQREWLSGDVLQAQLAYWKGQLADAPPLLTLPTDHPRPAVQSYRGDHLLFTLSGDLSKELKRLSQQNSTTLFMTLQAAFAVLLSRYAGQEEILIGTPIANRQVREIEDLIGFFVNTLVLRNDLSDNPSFRDLLTSVRQVTLDAYQQQALPFELLVETLQPERSLSHSPLFQVMFTFENTDQELFSLADLTVTPIDIDYPISKFDLTLAMQDASHEAGLSGWWEYNSDLFERTTIERMATHFQTLLEGIVANPDQPIAHLPLLTEPETHQLLVEWNESQADYPSDKCIHELFEQHAAAARTAETIAVVFGDETVTYHELNTRANQLAHYLIAQGVGPDVLVGICVERSVEMVVGLLGILKAGGAYVPLDPNYPQQRLAFMLEDASLSLLLTQEALRERLPPTTVQLVCLDSDWAQIGKLPSRNVLVEMEPDNLAYVIYTSGSTGRPKGVLVQHNNVVRLLSATDEWFGFNESDVWTFFHSVAFDFSVWEIWGALLYGGRLVVVPYLVSREPELFYQLLGEQGVTVLNQTPSAFKQLIQYEESLSEPNALALRFVIFGGEALEFASLQPWFSRHGDQSPQLINMYGITETTVHVTYRPVTLADLRQSASLIGEPIPDLQLYILDAHQAVVPIGIPGELYVGGVGVSRGYLNRPTLTAERFIKIDSLGIAPDSPRLYRTGDLARRLPNGDIEYMGRIDKQVKIRGFRIELGEIEAALNSQPNVREAVVVVRDEASGKRLVAYVVGDAPAEGLRAALSLQLPNYMIPSAFVELSAMPQTPNGKINRRALPAPDTSHSIDEAQLVLPRTPTEEILAVIWQEVLGLEQVGIHNNFFEIGGHSLLAMQVVSRIRQTAQIELPLRRLFSAPTIAELASQLISAQSTLPPLVPVDQLARPEPLPLSFGQQRLWFLQQLEAASDAYNIPAALRLCGPLDVPAFSASCRVICERHEVLRTTFPQVDGQAHQQINPPSFNIELIDLSNLPKEEQEGEVARLSRQEAKRPFDLVTGPLWRVTLLRLGSQEHVLLLTMHHIISDGWSTAVLMRELSALYNNHRSNDPSAPSGLRTRASFSGSLTKLPVQYADFAVWQREWLTGDVLQRHLDYWKAQLADAPPLLTLPTDHPRPAVQRYRGDEFSFTLPQTVSNALKSLSQKNGTTLFMTLQAAFAVLLSRYSGQEDILIGTPIANRQVAEVENLIGFFVNTLVLRNDLSDNPSFRDFLARVRQVTLDAYQQQALPFELLVETLQPERTLSHSPLFQVVFTLQNNPQDALSFADVKVSPIEGQSPAAKFDLTLTMQETSPQEGLIAWWKYSTDLFERTTIRRMATHFQTLLEGIVANPDQPIAHLPLLTERETHQLLVEWNDTATDYPQDKCFHQLFEQHAAAERTPEAIAVVFGDQQLTYRELNGRANQLAHYLIAQGVGPDVLVGICVERSVEMMVGLLGILKAGGAYVPLDPNYPAERLAFMLSDAQVKLTLTHSSTSSETGALRERLSALTEARVLDLASNESLFGQSQENPGVKVESTHLAYVIYTSGSTGRPKGVMIAHQGLVNYLSWSVNAYPVREGSGIPVSGSFSFDGTIPTLFGPLLVGQRVILLPEDNPIEALSHQLRHAPEQFSLVKGTPTHLQLLNDLLARGAMPSSVQTKALVLGGEALPSSLLSAWWAHAPESRVFNQYGPTEATVACAFYEVSKQTELTGTIPIGRPIPNTQLYILDRHLQPVPIGMPGELHIGGVGLARGYLNRPQLSKEKFIPNPFGPGRLYKTGDLCRYLPDGNIEFLGRTDHQVKIRGFRIELGEIEAVLNSLPSVREAVVVVREEGSGSKRLVAYIVGEVPSRAQLSQKLPDYMIPHAFVSLEAMPLTPNGKINRRALPAPEYKVDQRQLVWPRTPVESTLAAIWQEVLGLEQLGVTENFFQVGGDSIISIQIVSRAREAGIHLTPKELFQYQTIAELASVAREGQKTHAEQGIVTGVLPLTPIQHRFFAQGWGEPHHFNQSMLLELTKNVNPTWLLEAVRALLTHHDALRLRFERQGNNWGQEIVAPEPDVPFEVIDLSAEGPSEQATQLTEKGNQLQASLNLSQGPLVRVVLFEGLFGLPLHANRLLIIIHHLAVDGVSWRILLEDLQRAYQQLANGDAIELPAKTTSFKEWSTLLNEVARKAENEASALWAEREYWAQVSRYTPPLPVDYAPRWRGGLGANDNASAAHISTRLSAAQTEALLNEVPAVYHTQINDLLLTALALAFQEWTGQSALLLELEGHGREDFFEADESRSVDLSRTVGWFTSVFPVRLELTASDSEWTCLGDTIKSVKEQLRRLPNRGIGYGILRYLHPKRMISPLDMADVKAEVSFNYLGQFDQMASGTLIKGFAGESSGVPHSPDGERRYLLSVNGMIVEGQLQVDWTYSRNYHRAATIQQLANRFLNVLQALIAHCQEPDAGGYTPSDFPEAQLNQEELDDLLSGLNAEQQKPQIEAIYPLSPMQQGMLFHSLYAPQSGVYFEQMAITLRGPLDHQAFKQAWQQVVARHAVLRTLFVGTQRQQPLQVVCQEVQLPWAEQDWRSLDDPEAQLASYLAAERAQGFELQRAPLMRCALMRVDDECYYFVRNHHHLLSDGWSTALLMKEVWAFYEAACRGQPLFRARPRPYKAYIAWLQQQGLSRGTRDHQAQAEAYWRQTLQGFTAPTPLVVDRVDYGAVNDQKTHSEHYVTLSSESTAALQQMARESRLTLNTVIQGAWALLLARYSGEPEVLFGATVSGRPAELSGVETMVGLFINTLPVRVLIKPDAPVRPWLSELQEQQREREEYAYSALVDIQGWSDVPRGTPLFESLLVYENYPVSEESRKVGGDLQITGGHAVEQTNYPLTVVAALIEKEEGGQLYLALNYDTSRFEHETIERMAGHLQTLIAGIVADPDQSLAHLPVLTECEKHQLLVEWNDTQADYPSGARKCVHQLFEQQAERTPEAIAVVAGSQQLTYHELNARANQLAHYLIGQGVGPDVLVAICVERSIEMVVGLLGILKAGGAYVPLDPSYPNERLQFMLEDAKVNILLTEQKLASIWPQALPQLYLDQDWWVGPDHSNPVTAVRSDHLAYCIYTSGSTGKPKGVLIPHGGLLNLLFWHQEAFQVTSKERATQLANMAFDASVWEVWPYLTAGATLYLVDSELLSVPAQLQAWLLSNEITITFLPTPLAEMAVSLEWPNKTALRIMLTGGDKLRQFPNQSLPFQFVNNYGPTENSVVTTSGIVKATNRAVPSIGRPIANTEIYILDSHLQPVPIGVPGELHIGGAGLARGYKDRPQLTFDAFIPNPFRKDTESGRLYKTGDLCRYLPSGDIEFLGRADYQVKIRGFRIELGEIEALLAQHESVREVVVIVREESGIKRLVAYLVIEDSFVAQEPIPKYTLRAYLGEKLPDYMIPSAFVELSAMPQTPNGKIDRRALPAPEASHLASSAGFMAPRNQSEQQLVHIWQEVLGVHSVGIRDSFFDLGGHSLLAVRLMAQIQQHFGVNLPLATLFQYPTIEELATRLAEPSQKSEWSALVPIQPNGHKLPFFCVPGAGGNVVYFYDLARFMGRSHPFYGLQAVGLDGETAPLTTVEAIAAHYVKVILSVQPEGPYLLGGHSFGGKVIFEMAQQLQRAGHEVARLMIFDTSAPTLPTEHSAHTQPSEQASWNNAKWLIEVVEAVGTLTGQDTALSYEHLLPLDAEEQLIRFKEELERLNYLPTNSDIKQVRGWVQVFKTNNLMTYMPRTVIPTPITLFRAADSESNAQREDPAWGWNRLAKGPASVISVPGNHTTMMTTPHIQVLAERLKESLQKI